jgi:hypothetical protein
MPIRLKLKKEPYIIHLPLGVWVKVRPLNTATYEMAKAKAQRMARKLSEDSIEAVQVGATVNMGDLPDITDPDGLVGVGQLLFTQALAQAAIMEWAGVFHPDNDEPLPVSEQSVADLMRVQNMAEVFLTEYTKTHTDMVMEGNVSSPAPSGTSAAGPDTADGAATKEAPAPAVA